MADNDLRFSTASSSIKRQAPNVSGGWIVMVLSGLIAVVIFLFVTAQGGNRTEILVAARDIGPGEKVSPGLFRSAEVDVDSAQMNRLIAYKDRGVYDGYFATGPLKAGDIITKSQLGKGSGGDKDRTMSIPIAKTHANNGNIQVGDRVDLNDEEDGVVVAANLLVVAVDSQGSGGLAGGGSDFVVTVAVDSNQSVAISSALLHDIDLVRATGAAPGTPTFNFSTTTTTSTTTP